MASKRIRESFMQFQKNPNNKKVRLFMIGGSNKYDQLSDLFDHKQFTFTKVQTMALRNVCPKRKEIIGMYKRWTRMAWLGSC